MSDDLLNDLLEIFEIEQDSEIEFKEVYGFTFVFINKITIIRDKVSSVEINPVGIIYKENEEYYFVPLDKAIKVDEIVKEYVKIIPEEEYSHSQQ